MASHINCKEHGIRSFSDCLPLSAIQLEVVMSQFSALEEHQKLITTLSNSLKQYYVLNAV